MSKRNNWEDFKNILEQHHITTLYHFTDRDNLETSSSMVASFPGRIVRNVELRFLSPEVVAPALLPGRSTNEMGWSIM